VQQARESSMGGPNAADRTAEAEPNNPKIQA